VTVRDFRFTSSEAIFQAQPFVAVKDVYGRYFVADCVATGINSWETSESFLTSELGKAAVALTDTMGNQSISSIRFLPDDRFFDNHDYEYAEVSGELEQFFFGGVGDGFKGGFA
jgi:hypothetical protein